MNLYKSKKFFGIVCFCAALTVAGHQTAFASPAEEVKTGVVAAVAAENVSIYAEGNENSAVVATAVQGATYQVLEQSGDNWVKVAANGLEGYIKVQSEVILTKVEETVDGVSEAAGEFMQEQALLARREQLVDYALQFVGGRYVYGGSDPHTGVDCSGFIKYVMQHGAGVNMNRSSSYQATQGTPVSAEEMQPGDLIFYGKGKRINHVAMYIGDGQVVHASTEKTGIKTSPWNYRAPVKIMNVIG